ncbi:hypothetical protein [Roseicyclus elongatus]|nr:hypothetical protein [Roseibacterium elongatum]
MTDTMSVFETARDTIGGHLLAAHVRHLQDLTSELMARAEVYGIALSVSGHSPEDTALAETGDAGPWREALAAGADIYWTSLPARVVAIRDE